MIIILTLIVLSWTSINFVKAEVTIRQQLLTEIWNDDDPFNYVNASYIDHDYPHTNLNPELIAVLLAYTKPVFWLEAGSMLGGSIIRTADQIKLRNMSTSIISIDPFAGDVNMIVWEHQKFLKNEWRFIRNEYGKGRIYDRFLANIYESKHNDIVLPVVCTAIVGMKAIKRLHVEGRLRGLPEVIYLDSAHELEETFLELKIAWKLLVPGGILFGDDWGWEAVRNDVLHFAQRFSGFMKSKEAFPVLVASLPTAFLEQGIIRYKDQWVLVKKDDIPL